MAVDQAPGGSRAARIVVATAAAGMALAAAVHLGMVFLHVAPSNVLSRSYSEAIDGYIAPEFTQNWKLFAPEPLHADVFVHARADLRVAGGSSQVTGWVNVSAEDIEGTRYNLLPSHTRNQLRKGWRMFVQTHDAQNRAENLTGLLLETYLKRMALLRLRPSLPDGAVVDRVQLRAATTRVAEPAWSTRSSSSGTSYRVLPWLAVNPGDIPEGD